MTLEEFLSQLLGFIAQWGPVAIGAAAVLFLLVFGLAVAVFVASVRSMVRMRRDHDRMRARFDGRWNR